MLLRHDGITTEAKLTQNSGRPALLLAGAALLFPDDSVLAQYVIVQASANEAEALRRAGFRFKEPSSDVPSPPPDDDDPLF